MKKRRPLTLEQREHVKAYMRAYHLRNQEKACARARQWRLDNPEHARETKRKYRAANREKHRGYSQKYFANNRDKVRESDRRWRKANREKINAGQRDVSHADPEKHRARSREYYKNNKAKHKASNKRWRERNIDHHRNYQRRWFENNKDRRRMYVERRRSAKARQIHPEHDWMEELRVHGECVKLTSETGIIHHVDHIVPITKGGWHHHLNLQVLPASVNQRKSADPFWEMPGYKSWRDVPEYLWPEKLVPSYRALKEKAQAEVFAASN